MLFDLLYEVVGEISPMYFYLSIILSIICSYRMMNMGMHHSIISNHDYTRECHAIHMKLLPMHEPISQITEIHNWITHVTKRIDAPDDDTDVHTFSFQKHQILRGGKLWGKSLYSLSEKNIVL